VKDTPGKGSSHSAERQKDSDLNFKPNPKLRAISRISNIDVDH
jgi:hypothetical protein